MTLPTAAALEAEIAQGETDLALLNAVVHGPATGTGSTVDLGLGGVVYSLAKAIASLSGILSYATKAAMDADLAHPAGMLAYVTNDATAANNFFYKKAGGSGSGSWEIADKSFFQSILDSSPALDVERVKPTGFSYVPGRILGCSSPRKAIHDIDLRVEWDKNYHALTGTPDLGERQPWSNGARYFVGPNGNNSWAGTQDRPFATVDYCYQTSGRTVWLLPGDYKELLSLNVADRNLGGSPALPRAMEILAVEPGTARFVGNNSTAAERTWVVSTFTIASVSQKFNVATPASVGSGIGILNAIVRRLYDSVTGLPIYDYYETGGVTHRVHRIEILPYYDATTLGSMVESFGWNQNSGTKEITIRYGNLDFNTIKANFDLIYYTSGFHEIQGTKTFLGGLVFYGTAPIDVDDDGVNATELYMQDCQIILGLTGNGFTFRGAKCYQQRTIALYSGADNLSYSGNSVGDLISRCVEIDCLSLYSGFIWSIAGLPGTDTQQPSTTHTTTYMCRINGIYGKGYGQSIADTGALSKSWMVGTECLDPYYNYDGGTEANRVACYLGVSGFTGWIDNVRFGGRGSSYGLQNDNGTLKAFHSFYSGTTAAVLGTTPPSYVPASP